MLTYKHTYIQRGRLTERQTYRKLHAHRKTDRQTDGRTEGWTNKQTDWRIITRQLERLQKDFVFKNEMEKKFLRVIYFRRRPRHLSIRSTRKYDIIIFCYFIVLFTDIQHFCFFYLLQMEGIKLDQDLKCSS